MNLEKNKNKLKYKNTATKTTNYYLNIEHNFYIQLYMYLFSMVLIKVIMINFSNMLPVNPCYLVFNILVNT